MVCTMAGMKDYGVDQNLVDPALMACQVSKQSGRHYEVMCVKKKTF